MSTAITEVDFEKAMKKFASDRDTFFLDLSFNSAEKAKPTRPKSRIQTQKIIVPDATISAAGIQAVVDSLVASGELKAPPKVADFIDASYLGGATK